MFSASPSAAIPYFSHALSPTNGLGWNTWTRLKLYTSENTLLNRNSRNVYGSHVYYSCIALPIASYEHYTTEKTSTMMGFTKSMISDHNLWNCDFLDRQISCVVIRVADFYKRAVGLFSSLNWKPAVLWKPLATLCSAYVPFFMCLTQRGLTSFVYVSVRPAATNTGTRCMCMPAFTFPLFAVAFVHSFFHLQNPLECTLFHTTHTGSHFKRPFFFLSLK